MKTSDWREDRRNKRNALFLQWDRRIGDANRIVCLSEWPECGDAQSAAIYAERATEARRAALASFDAETATMETL